jgi:hypothetical protein
MNSNKTFIDNFEEISNSLKTLFSEIESKMSLLKEANERINIYVENLENSELRSTMGKVSNEIFGNYQNVLSKILSDQINIQDRTSTYIEEFFLRSQEYNRNWISQLNHAGMIEHDSLRKRSIESLNKEMNNFYSLFQISLNQYT